MQRCVVQKCSHRYRSKLFCTRSSSSIVLGKGLYMLDPILVCRGVCTLLYIQTGFWWRAHTAVYRDVYTVLQLQMVIKWCLYNTISPDCYVDVCTLLYVYTHLQIYTVIQRCVFILLQTQVDMMRCVHTARER